MSHTPPGRTRERVFRFVRDRLADGRPPTVREVQEAFGFRAPASAREQLETLVAEGRLEKDAGRSRGYRLPAHGGQRRERTALVPILGSVQAGTLHEAIEEADGVVPVSTRTTGRELFALRVRGESMRDAGILEGDLVIVRKQGRVENGQIVVALVGNEATVKTLRLANGRVELHPANPDFAPMVFMPRDVEILGPVIEVRRVLEGRRR
jgi:repressor LexA